MRRTLAASLLISAALAGPGHAEIGGKACPIDQVVGIIQSVDQDATKAAIKRAPKGASVPVTLGACLLYGDRLETEPGVVVTIRTTAGIRRVGGPGKDVYEAPEPVETVSVGVMSYLAAFYQSFFSRNVDTVYATGRANALAPDGSPAACGAAQDAGAPLVPLDRLRETRQRVGADLGSLVAAWKPSGKPHSVRATLRAANGEVIAQAETCGVGHVALSWPPGGVHAGDALRLEIVDGGSGRLAYDLEVIDPKALPTPPVVTHSQWLDAAWRLVAAPPDTWLDSLARLQIAPPDNLAAQAISEAVFSDTKF